MKIYFRKFLERKLGKWAKQAWLVTRPEVIAITGSTAKTSTKEAICAVMRAQFGGEVFCSPGNMNSEFGMPLAILGFNRSVKFFEFPIILLKGWLRIRSKRKFPHWWVLEMGSDKPGDIKYLTSLVQPNSGVITTVGPVHLQALGSIEGVYEEKVDLVRAVKNDGAVFLNRMNNLVTKMADQAKGRVIYYSGNPDEIAQSAAEAVGRYYKIDEQKIEQTLANFKSLDGRMSVVEGINGSVIIDDSYNSNPLSMEVALYCLDKLAKARGAKRKIVIVGDMLELGNYTKEAHRVMKEAIERVADYTVGIGPLVKDLQLNEWYEDSDAKISVLNQIGEGDIILVKASRGIHLDNIVKRLKK
ncbi:MAG: Mur ligase family protein [bacterium]|nr:Mur ligase family protein [bacterium]